VTGLWPLLALIMLPLALLWALQLAAMVVALSCCQLLSRQLVLVCLSISDQITMHCFDAVAIALGKSVGREL
jgi:hypothetical protein